MTDRTKYYPPSTKVIPFGIMTGRLVRASSTTVALDAGAYHVVDRVVNLLAQSSAATVSGSAGWRYVLIDTAGACSVETIPGGEITADTTVYAPAPSFNSAYGGYYSSVNTSKRIVGVVYFDSSTITFLYKYGNGRNKNTSRLRLETASPTYAGTNTAIMRVETDTELRGNTLDFTVAHSAANGTSVTINEFGKYKVKIIRKDTTGKEDVGVSLNASGADLTTRISLLSTSKIILLSDAAAGSNSLAASPSEIIDLQVNDVLRVHGNTSGNFSGFVVLIVERVG